MLQRIPGAAQIVSHRIKTRQLTIVTLAGALLHQSKVHNLVQIQNKPFNKGRNLNKTLAIILIRLKNNKLITGEEPMTTSQK